MATLEMKLAEHQDETVQDQATDQPNEAPIKAAQDGDVPGQSTPDQQPEETSSEPVIIDMQTGETHSPAETEAQKDDLFLEPEESEGEVFTIDMGDPAPERGTPEEGGAQAQGFDTLRSEVDELRARLDDQGSQVNQLRSELDQATSEREEFRTKLLRSAADLENFRKRKEREKEEMRRYGVDKIVLDLLPAVDNMERALEHASDGAEEGSKAASVIDGIKMVHRQLITALEKHGVQSFDSVGERFDPRHHEAIQQIDTSEHETGTIMQEYQKGYFLHDRLLRPALTVVAKHVPSSADEAPQPQDTSGDTPEGEEPVTQEVTPAEDEQETVEKEPSGERREDDSNEEPQA